LTAPIALAKLQQRETANPSRTLAESPKSISAPNARSLGSGCRLRSTLVAEGVNDAVGKELDVLGFRARPSFQKNGKPLGTQTRIIDAPNQTVADLFEQLKSDIVTFLNLTRHIEEKKLARDKLKQSRPGSPKRKRKRDSH
jgi:hypothetical protein